MPNYHSLNPKKLKCALAITYLKYVDTHVTMPSLTEKGLKLAFN